MNLDSTNPTDLLKFLQSTLKDLDEAAGEVDEESHAKLAQLKSTLEQKTESSSLLSEQSISDEILRLEESLTQLETKIGDADPMTKDLLGQSARIFTNSEEKKKDS